MRKKEKKNETLCVEIEIDRKRKEEIKKKKE